MPYSRASVHKSSCLAKCLQCQRAGPKFPCVPDDDGFKIFCKDCQKTFKSKECLAHHLKAKVCKSSKKCLDCGVIYGVKVPLNL
jgi:hypothetical protein